MAVIWGLDLKEIKWSKFKSGYMWCDRYHLRRTKFIVYQLAMILCVVSESLGTATLSDYIDQQKFIASKDPRAQIHNNPFVGAFSYNIFVGVYVATIFGAAFFFDLFWPERHESTSVRLAWRICSVLAPIFVLSSAILDTVLVAKKFAFVTGVSSEEAQQLLALYGKSGSPLVYRKNARAVASVVFSWTGLVATIASTIIMWKSYAYIEQHGTSLAAHVRHEAQGNAEPKQSTDTANGTSPSTATESPVVGSYA